MTQGFRGEDTTVQLAHDPSASFPRPSGSGWDQAPGAIHTPGDTIDLDKLLFRCDSS